MKTTQKWEIGDCSELIKDIKNGSIDIIITDPPYGTTSCDFDVSRPPESIYDEYHRVLKNTGWLFSFGPIDIFCDIVKNGKWRSKFEYVWIKPIPIPKTYNTVRPSYQHEMIFVFIKKSLDKMSDLTYNEIVLSRKGIPYNKNRKSSSISSYGKDNNILKIDKNDNTIPYITTNNGIRLPTTVLSANPKQCMKHAERTDHPTQKPLDLIELIISGYSNKGDLVLDPFLGSGTTLEACYNTNRNCIGFEIDPQWERLYPARAHTHQGSLSEWL